MQVDASQPKLLYHLKISRESNGARIYCCFNYRQAAWPYLINRAGPFQEEEEDGACLALDFNLLHMHACLQQAALITPPVPAPARQEQLSKHSCTVPPASENHASSVRSVPFLSFPSQIHRLIGCERIR